jgi:hypothetical protein
MTTKFGLIPLLNFHFLLTYSWFSNIICHWLILIHLNFHLYLHKISFWLVFLNYFDSTLRREIRIRDRFRKTFLKVKSVLTETKSEVWDNCGQTNCNRLEKIKQLITSIHIDNPVTIR